MAERSAVTNSGVSRSSVVTFNGLVLVRVASTLPRCFLPSRPDSKTRLNAAYFSIGTLERTDSALAVDYSLYTMSASAS